MATQAGVDLERWKVETIAVIGAGIVGIPMAALLAQAKIRQGGENPSRVVLIQRPSETSGWKVGAINAGRSPIGGIEPGLETVIKKAVAEGLLRGSHTYSDLAEADMILVCVQTDCAKDGPDYGPLGEALSHITAALKQRRSGRAPLIIFESTLAPTTMATVIKKQFVRDGLQDGRDIFLGHSPNRVMPGRLLDRVRLSDKLIGGLIPKTPEIIAALYSKIVSGGTLHRTNCLTAEVVKTLENAYRDVRIAYSSEIARMCDDRDIDFYSVRREVNHRLSRNDRASEDSKAVPAGGLLIPTIGVGGHCLPKDGYLLLWRLTETPGGAENSLILEARRINDESPAAAILLMERAFGRLNGRSIALMGVAYRPNSEDARHSPTLALGRQLLDKGCQVVLHDFYVKPDDPNLVRCGMEKIFTQDIERALASSALAVFCTAHDNYRRETKQVIHRLGGAGKIFDGCHLFQPNDISAPSGHLTGIGRGRNLPSAEFLDFVQEGFETVDRGVANEVLRLVQFFDDRFGDDEFNRLDFHEIQRLAGTCPTGCWISDPGSVAKPPLYNGSSSRLAQRAYGISQKKDLAPKAHD